MYARIGCSGVACLAVLLACAAGAQETYPAANEDEAGVTAGQRPYEMDWAGRTESAHPQLADFEDLTGWRVRCFEGADARLYRSRQEVLFGEYTAKVVYSGETALSRFVVEPPEPIEIPGAFTGVNLWVRGNNWGFVNPPTSARVSIRALVRDAKDEEYRIVLGVNDFDYWFLLHGTCVSPNGKTRLYEALGDGNDGVIDYPAHFAGIEVAGVSNRQPARLHFDALSFYEMAYEPLDFEPIPEDLPWPTTPDTILPTVTNFSEEVAYTYEPKDGTLGDLSAAANGQRFRPCWNGGITFEIDGQQVRPGEPGVKTRLVDERVEGDARFYDWELTAHGGATVRYAYTIRTKNKSCIVDVAAEGGEAAWFDIGLAQGLHDAKAVYIPYLTLGSDWPRIVCSRQGDDKPVFLLALLDYYHSDASELYGLPRLPAAGAVGYNGGAVYKPTTAGLRNPLRERLFINVSSDVHEVLPNIPNPACDTGDVAREYLWCNIGHAFQQERLSKYKAYGIDKFIACHHEVGWREAGESFTLRDRPAPSIGEQELADYGAWVRGLGYRFGTYTNYVDFAPVNANWNEDDVCLDSDGRWQRAWPRCYALKPLRAVEKEAQYAPRINTRYGTTAQYCDVHTAYSPWGRTDYDARTPGAGMFRTQFNAFARLLWNESAAHKGPVFSEGNHHWFYAGIVDGNYATMLPYGRGWQVPHVVDFDLLKMHPKMTDFGMGFGNMYYGREGEWRDDPSVHSPWFDRFHCATIAFGHIGFLSYEWGFEGTLKSYYLLQALQQRYAMVPVSDIRYFDGEKLVDTSTALITDAYKRSQVYVRYENGLEVWCNLSFEHDWRADVDGTGFQLPPTGFVARRPDDIIVCSVERNGRRYDLVDCDDYLFLDTRGEFLRMTGSPRLPRAPYRPPVSRVTTRGAVAIKRDTSRSWWVIPTTGFEEISICRTWLGGPYTRRFRALACGTEGECIAEAEVRSDWKSVTVVPVVSDSVVKYRLEGLAEEDPVWNVGQAGSRTREVLRGTAFAVWFGVECPKSLVDAAPEVAFAYVPRDGLPLELERVALGFEPQLPGWSSKMGTGRVELVVPHDAAPYSRCWYRYQLMTREGPVGNAQWLDVIALPEFDLTVSSGVEHVRPGGRLLLRTKIKQRFADYPEAVLRLDVDGLLDSKVEQQLRRDCAEPVNWSLKLPETPLIASVTLGVEAEGHKAELVRYLQTRPSELVIADLTRTPFERGMSLRGQEEMGCDPVTTGALVDVTREVIGDARKDALYMHPPYKTGVGYVFAAFDVSLPEGRPELQFALGFRAGSSTQDGCLFKALVLENGQATEVFAEQYATLNEWAPRSADLSPFAGRDVTLKLVTDVGPADNSYSDWAAWGEPRIVMGEPVLEVRILEEKPDSAFGPPPEPLAGLTRDDLAAVASATLTLDTAGVDSGTHASYVYFNGVKVGETPASGSDTEWQPRELALAEEALATVRPFNTVVIKNPNRDYMKVRHVCLRFELTDGRRGSSCVDLGPYCSASGWQFAEGTSVGIGSDLPEMMLGISVQ